MFTFESFLFLLFVICNPTLCTEREKITENLDMLTHTHVLHNTKSVLKDKSDILGFKIGPNRYTGAF